MTLDDLKQHLLVSLKVKENEVAGIIVAASKLIAFKYESELFKVFAKEDIAKSNQLSESESNIFFAKRYKEITNSTTDTLLQKITDEVIGDIIDNPSQFINPSN